MLKAVFDSSECISYAKTRGHRYIAIQIPSDYIHFYQDLIARLCDDLELNIFILADSSFSPCCADYMTASHVDATLLIVCGAYCGMSNHESIDTLAFHNSPNILKTLGDHPNWEMKLIDILPANRTLIVTDWANMELVSTFSGYSLSDEHDFVHFNRKYSDFNEFDNMVVISSTSIFVESLHLRYGHLCKIFAFSGSPQGLSEIPLTKRMKFVSKRYAVLEKISKLDVLGIVIGNLSTSVTNSLTEAICNACNGRGITTHVISVGKPNEQKIGNFPDVDALVFLSCPFSAFYEQPGIPTLTPYELSLFLMAQHLDIFSGPYYISLEEVFTKGLFNPELFTPKGTSSEVSVKTVMNLEVYERLESKTYTGLCVDEGNRDLNIIEGLHGVASGYRSEIE